MDGSVQGPLCSYCDGMLNVGWDMKMVNSLDSVAMKLGGKVCFGRKSANADAQGRTTLSWEWRTLACTPPNQGKTFHWWRDGHDLFKIFKIFGETISSKFNDWNDMMPSQLKDSGIKPFDPSRPPRKQ